jgi:magnesium transporter
MSEANAAVTQGYEQQINKLLGEVQALPPGAAAELLSDRSAPIAGAVLMKLDSAAAQEIFDNLPGGLRDAILLEAPREIARQWERNQEYPEDSIGRMMEPPLATFRPETTVGAAIEALRALVKTAFITYAYVTDTAGKLMGLVTMRDLLFADNAVRLDAIMLRDVFALKPDLPLSDAMKLVLERHYPMYPVCDSGGLLVGLVRGQTMFRAQAYEVTLQAGTMVGVEKEERLATPWSRSFKFRHPWLQLNLLTAFAAGAVVGIFEDTVSKLVVLAAFLPVLAGQSGNTGCQALAVTLRGLTLGELKPGSERALVMKEASLGFLNGSSTGIVAGLGMFAYATLQGSPHALMLAGVVWLALVGSCVVSGICGAMIPLTLKRLGADPATASSIFLTTATDVVSMGLLLGLATILVRV